MTALDSKATAAHEVEVRETAWPHPGARLRFHATAYCKGTTTASGTTVRTGIAAADPLLLPVGSVIQVDSLSPRYNGIYTVMDTGPAVQGREIDIYMWNCGEALDFGRRSIAINVLRLGLEPEGLGTGLDRRRDPRPRDGHARGDRLAGGHRDRDGRRDQPRRRRRPRSRLAPVRVR